MYSLGSGYGLLRLLQHWPQHHTGLTQHSAVFQAGRAGKICHANNSEQIWIFISSCLPAQIPISLQENVFHLVNHETRHQPTERCLVQVSYFEWDYNNAIYIVNQESHCRDPAVQALQSLESFNSKVPTRKLNHF